MPPDITTGPTAVAAGTLPGRASGLAATGPPGSDPLAALFAALLANSGGSPPTLNPASSLLRAALKPNTLSKTDGKTADPAKDKPAGKTEEKTLSAALAALPPLPAPIQMRPILPPIAGVSVGQETKDKKTMDTSLVPASPEKEKASVKPDGELPLQDSRMTASGVSVLSPVVLISSPMIVTPAPLAVPSAVGTLAALPAVQGALTALAASPAIPALGTAAVPTQTPLGDVPQSSPASGPTAPAATPAASSVLAQPTPADYLPPSQGVAVPTDAAQVPTKLPAGETVAADAPVVTPPIPVPTAAVGAGPGLVPTLPQAIVAVAVQTAANGLIVTDGKFAKDGVSAKDGKAATDGTMARDGEVTTDGTAAMDGKIATDGKTLAVGETPKTGLKSATVSADTITRSQAVPVKTLPVNLGLQETDKRSGRRTESVGSDAPLALPTTVPAQAGAVTTETKPLSSADRAEMIRQVADGVGAMPLPAKADASSQMTLQLHPKDWGQLQISVKIVSGADPGATQVVTAHIVAETPQVKAALENHSGDLRQALREAGLHLDKISVTVQRMEASAQAGTATSGGRHEASHGGASQGEAGAFGEASSNQQTGMSDETGKSGRTGMSDMPGNGMPSFTASGGSQGGRQGGQPPPAYAAAYAAAEPEDLSAPVVTRRTMTGQVDMRA